MSHYGGERLFKPSARLFETWNFRHEGPGQQTSSRQGTNVHQNVAAFIRKTGGGH